MRHPSESDLALLSGGDLTGLRRWMTARHVKNCPQCRVEVSAFRHTAEQALRAAAPLPSNFNWDAMAAEMAANIHVGVEAGRCIAPDRGRAADLFDWRPALALAMATLLISVAWFYYVPARRQAALEARKGIVVIEGTSKGIELQQDGAVFSLRPVAAEPMTVSVSGRDALAARYVNSETGQVTITHVYAE